MSVNSGNYRRERAAELEAINAELLAALEKFISAYTTVTDCLNGEEREDWDLMLDFARAAIAKAKGGTK